MAHDPNNYREQLERLEKLIRASELMTGAVFSFHSLVLGLFVNRSDYFQPIFQERAILVILGVLWILLVSISVYFCFMPRMELKYRKNVFFLKDVVRAFGNSDEYTQKLAEVCTNEEKLYTHLGHQICIKSKIIDKKFDSVKKSSTFFALSFTFTILIVMVWLIKLGF